MEDQLHLTDEQFTEVLFGAESAITQAHLHVCPQCTKEIAQVAGAVGDFKGQSKLWAERRAATHLLAANPRRRSSWSHRPQTWTTAALAIVIAATAGLAIHRQRGATAPSGVSQSQQLTQVSPATLKADNNLLSAIDGELQADDSTSASTYTPSTTAQRNRTKAVKRTINE